MQVQAGHRLGLLTGNSRLHFHLHAAADTQHFVLVPLPLHGPDAQLRQAIEDAGVDVLVTDTAHAPLAERIRHGLPTLMCNDEGEAVAHLEGDLSPPRDGPDLHCLIRTSGTTGDGHWIPIPRAALEAHRVAAMQRLQCTPESTWLAAIPFHHIGGVALLDRCLHGGGKLVLQDGFDAEATMQALMAHPITHVSLVPTMLHRLLELGQTPPSTLQCVLIGGDGLRPALARRALDAGWPIHASYGLTEACSQVATATPDDLRAHPDTCGRPLDGVQIRIWDDQQKDVAPGAVGEIVVSGPTLATPDPLRTGDLGWLDDLGNLYVQGRMRDRIVSGGENVLPARVEKILEQHPAVQQACVVGVPDDEWGQRVSAAVVLHPGQEFDPDGLMTHCKEHLAPHEVPKAYRTAVDLPATAAGKLRRHVVAEGFDQPTWPA